MVQTTGEGQCPSGHSLRLTIWPCRKVYESSVHDKIYFLLSGCRKREMSTFPTSAWLIVVVAIVSSGCSHNHLETRGPSKTSSPKTIQTSTKEWLPLREQRHQIVEVGSYRLPKPIPYAAGLTPFPMAIAYIFTPPSKVKIVRIFFPASQEQAVYQWAQLPPTLLAHAPGSRKYKRMSAFKAFDPITKRMKPINQQPVKAPYQWNISWAGSAKDKISYGYASMFFAGNPYPSLAGPGRPIDMEYAGVSPVQKEPRLISINVVL